MSKLKAIKNHEAGAWNTQRTDEDFRKGISRGSIFSTDSEVLVQTKLRFYRN
jgi:hypothetical protein